jgi:hypothetical protein
VYKYVIFGDFPLVKAFYMLYEKGSHINFIASGCPLEQFNDRFSFQTLTDANTEFKTPEESALPVARIIALIDPSQRQAFYLDRATKLELWFRDREQMEKYLTVVALAEATSNKGKIVAREGSGCILTLTIGVIAGAALLSS